MIFTKRLTKKEEEEERRTKQSLDSPQTIEANKYLKISSFLVELYFSKLPFSFLKDFYIKSINIFKYVQGSAIVP